MNWLDMTLLLVMVVSIGLGVFSGLVMQLFNLLILVVAVVLAGHLGGPLAGVFGRLTENEQACRIVAFILIFLIVSIGLRVAAFFLRGFVKKLRFGKWDHILGGVVGVLKGYLICVAIFMALVNVETGRLHDASQESRLMPPLGESINVVRVWISEENRERIKEFLRAAAASMKQAADDVIEKGREAAGTAVEKSKQAVDKVVEKVKE